MDTDKIKDRETLAAWLDTRPREDAIAIAHRVAMRVLPLFAEWVVQGRSRIPDLTDLPVLRANLTSGVARKYPTPEVKAAAAEAGASSAAAFAAALSDANASASAATSEAAAIYAADAAACATNSTAVATASTADAAVSAAAATADASWEQIRNDCRALELGTDPQSLPLWSSPPPDWLADTLATARAFWWRADPAHAFWLRWYDAALAGTPLPWKLQHAIALIPDDDWQAGPQRVAEVIALIEERFDLGAQVAALKEQLRQSTLVGHADAASLVHRSHNQPPELVEVEAELRRQITIIWAALDEVETELAKPAPAPSVLRRVGKVLVVAAKSIARYCGSLADVGLQAAATAIGTTLGPSVVGLLGVAALGYSGEVLALGKRLLDFSTKLMGGG